MITHIFVSHIITHVYMKVLNNRYQFHLSIIILKTDLELE